MLYKTQNLSRINMKDYLSKLVRLVEAGFRGPSQRVEIRQSVDELQVLIDVAIPCGLVVNELLSNALKHAFPDNRKGVVEIGLHRVGEHLLKLTIADNGVGLPPDFDITAGPTLGVQLVHQIVKRQLGGTTGVEAEGGVRWTMAFRDDQYGERV
jgi:two-component sensor histidine kinase